MLLSHLLISVLLVTLAHGEDCPISLSPPEVVVEYGDSVSVNCSTYIAHDGVRWEGFEPEFNFTDDRSFWTVEKMTDWEIQPNCVVIFNKTQCSQNLTITIYKTPDNVSISKADNIMTEGLQYELQCDVVNVAPVQNLIVKWYKGDNVVHNETFTDPIKTPVNKTSILHITADRTDDGVQYRCEAEMDLGEEGPQPPPTVTSELLNITVYYTDECSLLQLNPQRVVVKYGSSVSVDCSTNVTHNGIGWEATVASVPMTRTQNLITWRVPSATRWDMQPMCHISTNMTKCASLPPVIIYKTPDSVSISKADNIMTEGLQYELQCDVVNVAPVQNLIVKWYKGDNVVHHETFTDPIKTPVNKTSILHITVDRNDDGVQYRCEAEMDLGAEGPQPPPTVTSELLNITVYYTDECSLLQLNPQRVVVKYGSSVSVDCSTNVTHNGIGWETTEGSTKTKTQNLITWRVPSVTRWDMQPMCHISTNMTKCASLPPVIIYKTADRVVIRKADNIMTEGLQYKLQCDVLNVAPVQNLIVKWYKGGKMVHHETFTDPIKTPVNKASILHITADRTDDGVQYRCEAEMDLGAKGPQPPPTVTSEPLYITVHSVLQLNPQRVVVKYGSSVSVDCSTNVTHKGIGWEATEGVVPMIKTQNLITWTVPSVTRWDIQAMCYINYKIQHESHLPVTVYKTPDSVSIITVHHTGPMTEGLQYELQCDVVNVAPVQNLIVKWYKGGKMVHNETFTNPIKTPVNNASILHITADRTDDGVQYRCEAEMDLGAEGPQPPPTVTSEHLNITVHYKPQFSFCNPWSPKIRSTLSSYPSSYYFIMSNPSPSISWSRGPSSLNASIFLDQYDSDMYKITARNEHGESSCMINITVEYPTKLNCSGSFQIQEKTQFKHSCSVDGIPKPVISLYKDGKLIPLPYYPRWNDSGLYNLTASNEHGSLYHLLKINILHAPVFYTEPERIVVVADGHVTKNCSSSGNPEPHMWLSFKNRNISTGGRYVILQIQKATSTDSGEYICSASNEVGHRQIAFTVEIKENSSYSYILYIVLGLVALAVIFCLYMVWKKKNSSGHYQIQSELRPLRNGG